MTTFASAATPIVRIRPGEARQRERDVEQEDRRVEERGVDAEADHGDHAEEAVEDEQEQGDDQQADQRRRLRLLQRVLAQRGRDVGALDLLELDRQRARLEHERQVLRLPDALDARDPGAVDRVDPARVLLEVDRRERLDVAVEDDREVLVVVGRVGARRLAEPRVLGAPAHRLRLRDLAELLAPVAGEREQHLGLARGRVDVLLRAGELQVAARHLGDRPRPCRVVLEQVVVDARRRRLVHARADDRARPARDHDRPCGTAKSL